MNHKKEKQPWNPFPLACLKVEGLTACAKSILIYLGVRSNYKGETCVGYRTMQKELVRSKKFVWAALNELEEKGWVKSDGRDRRHNEADWKVLSPKILQRKQINVEAKVSIGDPLKVSTGNLCESQRFPQETDNRFPKEGETLQINSLPPNLTDSDLNLAEEDVYLPACVPEASVASLPPSSDGGEIEMMSVDQAENLLSALDKFGNTQDIPDKQMLRIARAHPEFVANPHNLGKLKGLLDQPYWRKKILNVDDFAFRWETHNENGLYDQLRRLCMDTNRCQRQVFSADGTTLVTCGCDAQQQPDGKWICDHCLESDARRLALKEEAKARQRERAENLSKCNFAKTTKDEHERFRLLQADNDGWKDKPITHKVSVTKEWTNRHVDAVIHHCLDKNISGVTFEEFSQMVEHIAMLEEPETFVENRMAVTSRGEGDSKLDG